MALLIGLWGGAVLGRVSAGAPIMSFAQLGSVGAQERARSENAPRAGVILADGMAFHRLRTETGGTDPRACLEFTRPLDPGTVNLQARWPAYVLGLLLFCVELPQAEVMLSRSRFASPFLLVLLAVVLVVIRRGSAGAARVALAYGDNDLLLLLDLSTPPPRRDERPVSDAGRQDEHRNPRSS